MGRPDGWFVPLFFFVFIREVSVTFEEAVAEVKNPPMYSSYCLEDKPKGMRLWRRTFAGVEVEWEVMMKDMTDAQLSKFQDLGVMFK